MDSHLKDLARVFKALADENRLKILTLVREGELRCECHEDGCDETRCLTDLVEQLGVSQATVSHHVKELVDTGVVTTHKKGRWVHCQIDREGITRLCEFLEGLRSPCIERQTDLIEGDRCSNPRSSPGISDPPKEATHAR